MGANIDIVMFRISHVFSFENRNVGHNHNVNVITLIILNENVLLQPMRSAIITKRIISTTVPKIIKYYSKIVNIKL